MESGSRKEQKRKTRIGQEYGKQDRGTEKKGGEREHA